MSRLIVAVDGPSGSGKSSVCRAAAKTVGAAYLDTGAMYRAATWYCLDQDVDLDDEDAVALAVESLPLCISTDPDHQVITVGETDVTAEIREARISEKVSEVATNRRARSLLIAAQRQLIDDAGFVVAEGRDITSVVAPDAQVRVLLTASAEARLRRRGLQMGGTQSEQDLKVQVLERDKKDSAASNFTEAADGVAVLDSSDLTLEETVEALVGRIQGAASHDPAL
ncbi:(d)CMP kinase [Nesterenkonia cremea]|uniref:Cytidylate kinase n=1 Tax=Nesterenkonia cremea TaxID=1882340 RepID=A0A917EP77_9MICC|nr:(d)CMP kinase [Nesterenkonia cremea]GGE67389.1 hypothetical protein GCM10011401_13420 [Nesterenkonia cremea]